MKERTLAMRAVLEGIFSISPAFNRFINDMAQVIVLQYNAHSKGEVNITSADPAEVPRVLANYYADPRDMANQLKATKLVIDLINSTQLDKYHRNDLPNPFPAGTELPGWLSCIMKTYASKFLTVPCPPPSVDRYQQWVVDNTLSSFHYFGSSSGAVSLDDFSVRGAVGLFVADASVLPFPTRVNPQATAMMMGRYVAKKLTRSP